jgi:hypothetical protein
MEQQTLGQSSGQVSAQAPNHPPAAARASARVSAATVEYDLRSRLSGLTPYERAARRAQLIKKREELRKNRKRSKSQTKVEPENLTATAAETSPEATTSSVIDTSKNPCPQNLRNRKSQKQFDADIKLVPEHAPENTTRSSTPGSVPCIFSAAGTLDSGSSKVPNDISTTPHIEPSSEVVEPVKIDQVKNDDANAGGDDVVEPRALVPLIATPSTVIPLSPVEWLRDLVFRSTHAVPQIHNHIHLPPAPVPQIPQMTNLNSNLREWISFQNLLVVGVVIFSYLVYRFPILNNLFLGVGWFLDTIIQSFLGVHCLVKYFDAKHCLYDISPFISHIAAQSAGWMLWVGFHPPRKTSKRGQGNQPTNIFDQVAHLETSVADNIFINDAHIRTVPYSLSEITFKFDSLQDLVETSGIDIHRGEDGPVTGKLIQKFKEIFTLVQQVSEDFDSFQYSRETSMRRIFSMAETVSHKLASINAEHASRCDKQSWFTYLVWNPLRDLFFNKKNIYLRAIDIALFEAEVLIEETQPMVRSGNELLHTLKALRDGFSQAEMLVEDRSRSIKSAQARTWNRIMSFFSKDQSLSDIAKIKDVVDEICRFVELNLKVVKQLQKEVQEMQIKSKKSAQEYIKERQQIEAGEKTTRLLSQSDESERFELGKEETKLIARAITPELLEFYAKERAKTVQRWRAVLKERRRAKKRFVLGYDD